MGYLTNQGRDADRAVDAVNWNDLRIVSETLWLEARRHPLTATCECPAIEVVAHLQELGYEISKPIPGHAPSSAQ